MKTIPSVSGFYFVELKYFTSLTELPYSASPANYMIVSKPGNSELNNSYPKDCYFEAYGEKFPILAIGKAPNGIDSLLDGGFNLKAFPTIADGLCELKDFDRNHPQEWVDENLIVLYRITAASDCRYNYYQLCDKYRSICGLYGDIRNIIKLSSTQTEDVEIPQSDKPEQNIIYSYGNDEFNTNPKTRSIIAPIKPKLVNWTILSAIGNCYRNYFNFSGRASRFEYWSFGIVWGIIGLIMGFLAQSFEYSGNVELLIFIYSLSIIIGLFNIIPYLAVSWRRMHDIGYAGWVSFMPYLGGGFFGALSLILGMYMMFVVIVGTISTLLIYIYLFYMPGDNTANRYGEPNI